MKRWEESTADKIYIKCYSHHNVVQRFLVFRLRTLPAWNHCHLQKKKLELHITVIPIVGSNLSTKFRNLAKTLEMIPLQYANLNLRQVIFCKFSHCLLVDAPPPPSPSPPPPTKNPHILKSIHWLMVFSLDQFMFLENCPPTPPLSHHFALSEN